MKRRASASVALCAALWNAGIACRKPPETPPPEARRPVLKTEWELAAERELLIRSGAVVPTSGPVLVEVERQARAAALRPAPLVPTPNAIQSDILLVNDAVLTVAEVLYPLRHAIDEARRTQTRRGFTEQVTRWVRIHTQQEIGSLLVYAEAMAGLDEPQKKSLEEAVEREYQRIITQDFGGSAARLAKHLERFGLTKEKFHSAVDRRFVVQQYTRERLMPQVFIRRDELLSYYRKNAARYAASQTRELLMIEAPFDRFLPPGVDWEQASPVMRAQGRLQAVRHIRAAHAALAERPFDQVAREFSRGTHAETGGSWGQIGRPLQPPLDELSARVFELDEGQFSEPLEISSGWYIVGCGRIERQEEMPFAQVQHQIRAELAEERFNALAAEYVVRLAEKATLSSLDAFVTAALRRAESFPTDEPESEPLVGTSGP